MDGRRSKRKRSHTDSEASADDGVSSSDGSASSDEQLLVQFAGHPPAENDFHGIKRLLQQLLLGAEIDFSGLADIILQQPGVSVCLKVDDDEDSGVFGVLSPINVAVHKDVKCVKELRAFLLAKASAASRDARDNLTRALQQSEPVCLLINERMVNVPAEIAGPLHQSLQADLKEAVKEKEPFDFASFVIVSKSYAPNPVVEKSKGKRKKTSESEGASGAAGCQMNYVNIEDEYFAQHCQSSFSYPVKNEEVSDDDDSDDDDDDDGDDDEDENVQAFRTVFLLNRQQMKQAWRELQRALT